MACKVMHIFYLLFFFSFVILHWKDKCKFCYLSKVPNSIIIRTFLSDNWKDLKICNNNMRWKHFSFANDMADCELSVSFPRGFFLTVGQFPKQGIQLQSALILQCWWIRLLRVLYSESITIDFSKNR